jgi:sarcosine oxidase/L-pipecolate oxidase
LQLAELGSKLIFNDLQKGHMANKMNISAFKFLPVLGTYIADCFENKAPTELRRKWSFPLPAGDNAGTKIGDGSRAGPPLRILNPKEMSKL